MLIDIRILERNRGELIERLFTVNTAFVVSVSEAAVATYPKPLTAVEYEFGKEAHTLYLNAEAPQVRTLLRGRRRGAV